MTLSQQDDPRKEDLLEEEYRQWVNQEKMDLSNRLSDRRRRCIEA
jgi:hypothetical protein